MAIIRPMQKEDFIDIDGPVKYTSATGVSRDDNYRLDSTAIFGSSKFSGYIEENVSVFARRGYIPLSLPVMNYFLAGSKLETFRKLLDRKDIMQIAEGNVIYDLQEKKDIAISANSYAFLEYASERYLIGAAYVEKLIKDVDIEVRIREVLTEGLPMKLKSSMKGYKFTKDTFDQFFSITKGTGLLWLADDYYLSKVYNFEVDLSTVSLDSYREKLLEPNLAELTILLHARESKEVFSGMVMSKLVAIPSGYRPTIEKRVDPLTKIYNRVIEANNSLQMMLRMPKVLVKDIVDKYKELVRCVKMVMIDKDMYDTNHKPLKEMLIHKEGDIRDQMYGTRVDYSGRSVITVDPFLSVDCIGVPERMLAELMSYHVVKNNMSNGNKSTILDENQMSKRTARAAKEGAAVHMAIGRQPTLYSLGIQAYKVIPTKGDTIVLNPLSTLAFNADFDGDQMYIIPALTEGAQAEMTYLMSSLNNAFLSRNGEIHIVPRHEILYGLWLCTDPDMTCNQTVHNHTQDFLGLQEVFELVCNQTYKVDDIIRYSDGGPDESAGMAAFRHAIYAVSQYAIGVTPLTEGVPNKRVTTSYFKVLLQTLLLKDKSKFVTTVNKLVRLGFIVASYYPPNIQIMDKIDVTSLIHAFEETIEAREELYNLGFESTASYNLYYSQEYAKLEKKILSNLLTNLDQENGYLKMMQSGARGSMSNLYQLFGCKGRLQKNSDKIFNTIVSNSLVNQLTGLEHFITAYGGRQGQIDKVVETFEPGYLSRQMTHCAAPLSIVSKDCKTSEGILLTYDIIKQFYDNTQLSGDDVIDNLLIKEAVSSILEGRYIVGRDALLSKDVVGKVYDFYVARVEDGNFIKGNGLKLRSPMTCATPCCSKCYGVHLGSHATATPGLPIGYIAAGSIGEPGTQLTMKNFQKGGVADSRGLTSSFDLMAKYIHMSDFKGARTTDPIQYDYISPVDGDLVTIDLGNGTKELNIMGYDDKGVYKHRSQKKVVLYEGVQLKSKVRRGESVQLEQGDLSPKEIMASRSPEEAALYVALRLYFLFNREVEVSLKHFEVMVASMQFYVCTKGNAHFHVGNHYTIQEYHGNDKTDAQFYLTIKGIKEVPHYRNDVFTSMMLEDIGKSIRRSIVVSGKDSMTNPLVRTSFGLSMGVGTDVPGYIREEG